MELRPEDLTKVRNRLRRAQGQLDAIVRNLDDGGDCRDMVTQIAACSKAIERAGYILVASGIRECAITPDSEAELEDLEKTLLSLA